MADGFSDNGAPLGVPYRGPVVEPQVPVADHTAAKIIASADIAGHFTAGLAAMGQIAAANKRAQLEAEQMATDASLKSRQLDIARENNLMDYRVGLQQVDALAKYRSMASAAKTADEAGLMAYATRIQNEITAFQQEKEQRGLNDPHPKNVAGFVGNHIELAKHFENADIPQIKTELSNLTQKAKGLQGEIPIPKYGAMRVTDGKGGFMYDGGSLRTFTAAQIMAQLADPATRSSMEDSLEASGLTKVNPTTKAITPPDWLVSWAKNSREAHVVPTTEPRPSIGVMSQWMAKRTPAETVAGQPSITTDSVDEASAAMAAESDQSVSTPPNVFDTSEVDTLVADYKRFKGQPGFNDAKARQFLINKYKVDPETQ